MVQHGSAVQLFGQRVLLFTVNIIFAVRVQIPSLYFLVTEYVVVVIVIV